MKRFRILSVIALVFTLGLITVNCAKDSENPPSVPPLESWSINFSNFESGTKSAQAVSNPGEVSNWGFTALVAGYFRTVMVVTMAIPVYSFEQAINKTPKSLGEKSWEWSYSTTILNNTYKARLTGLVRSDDVLWEMYVSQEGTGGFPEFCWFKGTSNLENTKGQWLLNHSYQFQEPVLQIDWEKTGTKTGTVKYTYIRALNDSRLADPLKNSYIEYGRTPETFDSYYTIHFFNENSFSDLNAEWNSITRNGRVKCPAFFPDNQWHCWNNNYINVTCP